MSIHHFIGIAYAIAAGCAFGQSSETIEAARKEIEATASNICTTIPIEGRSQSGGLSASAEAGINGALGKLLSKLGDLKLKGSADYSRQSFRNVLQKDLAQAIAASNDCRLAVFNTLHGKLVAAPVSGGHSIGSVTATGNGSGAIGVNNGTVVIGSQPAEPKK